MSQENATSKQPLIRPINRQQLSWRAVDVDHRARAIWTLVGRLNLKRFYETIESSSEEGGRPAIDPQLLISLWVYAYSEGIGSAREVARRCEFDPAFQWLTGLEEVNYHTLADFRVEKQQELDELFTQVLAALSKEGLITLEQVMQDGTKIRALASSRAGGRLFRVSFHLRICTIGLYHSNTSTMGDWFRFSGWPTLSGLNGRGFDFSFVSWPMKSFKRKIQTICPFPPQQTKERPHGRSKPS
jgi:transposase